MKELIDRAAELDVNSVVIGMPHRGRLNVLANVVRKPLASIFSEFSTGVKPAGDGVYTGARGWARGAAPPQPPVRLPITSLALAPPPPPACHPPQAAAT